MQQESSELDLPTKSYEFPNATVLNRNLNSFLKTILLIF